MSSFWGWAGRVKDFMYADSEEMIVALTLHHRRAMAENPSGSQVAAWNGEIAALRGALGAIAECAPGCDAWGLVLEYELPREGGRRPDVVLLAGEAILVLEFKSDPILARQYLDQVDAYARDLSEYHSASQGYPVYPVLVLVDGDIEDASHYGVVVTNASVLAEVVLRLSSRGEYQIELEDWLEGDYQPLPSLVRAARDIFEHQPLPRVRRAESSGVGEAVAYLQAVAQSAALDESLHLALVAGVPGAGKTLVGLRFVYETHFGSEDTQEAVFLSGNGPLVKVLQHTLSGEGHEGRVFVRDVHAFLKSYGGDSNRRPHEHIWVYDEAQRAWDVDKVREKRPAGFSEPEDFLRVGEKHGDWALMVGLIGEGQEIHVGEESGLDQWNLAMADVGSDWTVHCPARIASVFDAAARVEVEDALDLSVSLRAHRAEQVAEWVGALLEGSLTDASRLAEELKRASFALLVTRDADAAREYARSRYEEAPEARYGLMMSSQRKWSAKYGFRDDFYLNPGPWFADGERSSQSCRQLEVAVTEFQCQGLELDLPIVGWGGDLLWSEGWVVPDGVRKRVRHPREITKNVYRVLLTRGRDGVVVFVPDRAELDGVFEAMKTAGCDVVELIGI